MIHFLSFVLSLPRHQEGKLFRNFQFKAAKFKFCEMLEGCQFEEKNLLKKGKVVCS